MRKTKEYPKTHFSADVIVEALDQFVKLAEINDKKLLKPDLIIEIGDTTWNHDSVDEFLADYRRSAGYAYYYIRHGKFCLKINRQISATSVGIECVTRAQVENIFSVFERRAEQSSIQIEIEIESEKPRIFIGHGRSTLWRDLKDHLQDKHGLKVEAYEVGARAGHAIRDIMEDMLSKSTFAVLIMTGEDSTADGELRARQNVVHEVGLFQGRLGFQKAIVLLEAGTEDFSNIHGIDQIRFSKGNIRETFGEVLATIRREFPDSL